MRTPLAWASVGLVTLWSSGFIGAKLAAASGWLTVLTWRFLVTAAVLLLACAVVRPRVPVRALPGQVVVGLFSQVMYLALVFLAVDRGVPSGTVALIAALQPLVIATVAGPLLGEHPSRRQVVGLLLGLVGVALVVAHDLQGRAPWWAYLVVVGAMLSLTTGTVIARRTATRIPLLTSLTVQYVLTAVVYTVASALTGQLAPPATVPFWVAVGWLVVLSSFGGYGCFQFVVRRGGATMASTLLYLTPPTTMLWAWLMFGDRIGWLSLAGLVVCAVGVALALRRRPRPIPPADPVH